jgi:hypothetical protein
MQFLSGLGRYFETPAAAAAGEHFDITGVDANYQAPVAGVGRYFETPAAAAAGEHFDITGVDANYQAPVAGMGRYFEDAFGIRHGERFDIQGANLAYQAPLVGGVGQLPRESVQSLINRGLLSGVGEAPGGANGAMAGALPFLAGLVVGAAVMHYLPHMKK